VGCQKVPRLGIPDTWNEREADQTGVVNRKGTAYSRTRRRKQETRTELYLLDQFQIIINEHMI
jgi:hypothetical protein